jgi:hypothetical protein
MSNYRFDCVVVNDTNVQMTGTVTHKCKAELGGILDMHFNLAPETWTDSIVLSTADGENDYWYWDFTVGPKTHKRDVKDAIKCNVVAEDTQSPNPVKYTARQSGDSLGWEIYLPTTLHTCAGSLKD